MQDRIPTKPNRYAVYDDAHNFVRYEYHVRADEPTISGSALDKDNILPDNLATSLGLDPADDPQPKDAIRNASGQVGDLRDTKRNDLSDDWVLCNGENCYEDIYPELADMCQNGLRKWEYTDDSGSAVGTFAPMNIVTDGNIVAFIMLASDGIRLHYSDDLNKPLAQWTKKLVHPAVNPQGTATLHYQNNTWVIIFAPYSMSIMSSTDLTTWTSLNPISSTPLGHRSLAYGNGEWLIYGIAGAYTRIYKCSGDTSGSWTMVYNESRSHKHVRVDFLNNNWVFTHVGPGNDFYALISPTIPTIDSTFHYNLFKKVSFSANIATAVSKVIWRDGRYIINLVTQTGGVVALAWTSNVGETWTVSETVVSAIALTQFFDIANDFIFIGFGDRLFVSPYDLNNISFYPHIAGGHINFSGSGLLGSTSSAAFYRNGYYYVFFTGGTLKSGIARTNRIYGKVLPVITRDNVYTYIRGK